MRSGASAAATTIRRTASVVSSSITLPTSSSSSSSSRLHTVAPLHHNRPDWIPRSAHHFRTVKAEEDAADAALAASLPVEPFITVRHPHPAPLPPSSSAATSSPPSHFAVFRFRGQQFKVVEDDLVMVDRIVDGQVGDVMFIDDVLLLAGQSRRDSESVGRSELCV